MHWKFTKSKEVSKVIGYKFIQHQPYLGKTKEYKTKWRDTLHPRIDFTCVCIY